MHVNKFLKIKNLSLFRAIRKSQQKQIFLTRNKNNHAFLSSLVVLFILLVNCPLLTGPPGKSTSFHWWSGQEMSPKKKKIWDKARSHP